MIWTTKALQDNLSQRQHIFLAYLRVYQLPHPIEVPVQPTGSFVPLPHSLNVSESTPVLSDRTFAQRKLSLENRVPPLHPELEELHSAIAQMDNPAAGQLAQEISQLLDWASPPQALQLSSKLAWITTIADLLDLGVSLPTLDHFFKALP